QIFDGAARENGVYDSQKILPFVVTMRVVEKDEAAAQKIFAQAQGFGLTDAPGAGVLDEDPGPVVDGVVGAVDHLFLDLGVDAGEAANAHHELAIRFRVVGGPALKTAEGAASGAHAVVV